MVAMNTNPSTPVSNLTALLKQMDGLQLTINITGRIAFAGQSSGPEISEVENHDQLLQALGSLQPQKMQPHVEFTMPNPSGTAGKASEWTLTPAQAGNTNQILPEFGRWKDVERLFGIKRGKLYLLIQQGIIKSISLRRKGQKQSCRLIYLPGVRAYLESLLKEQNPNCTCRPQNDPEGAGIE